LTTIAFTISTTNFLGQVKVLEESFREHHPDITFYIGLVDKIPTVLDQTKLASLNIIPVEALKIPNFQELNKKLHVHHLCWALKSCYAQYFFKQFPNIEQVLFFDGDILILNKLKGVLNQLKTYDIILTPHLLKTTTATEEKIIEYNLTKVGLYNAGFFALKRGKQSKDFLKWWIKSVNYSCGDPCGDQVWLSPVPLFFKNVLISKDIGLNVAYWNIGNRIIKKEEDKYYVNENVLLKFFHFSGLDLENKKRPSRNIDYYHFSNRPDLIPIFEQYYQALERNGNTYFKQFSCYYYPPILVTSFVDRTKIIVRKTLRRLLSIIE